jgi:hypothetical protein
MSFMEGKDGDGRNGGELNRFMKNRLQIKERE